MAFETVVAGQVFRTKTAGDYIIGKVVELDETGKNACVVVETYEAEKRKVVKDGKETEEAIPKTFLVYDLNITRELSRRQKRIGLAKEEARRTKKPLVPEKRNACAYVLVECTGTTDDGQYGVYKAAFSDSRDDMKEEHAKRGAFYVFHEIPKEERPQRVRDDGAPSRGAGSDDAAAADDDFPF